MINLRIVILAVIVFSFRLYPQDMFTAKQLTFDPAQEGFSTWSPDGKMIVYQHTDLKDTIGKNGLWKITPDGKEAQQIYCGLAEHPRWSSDGRFIVFDADTGWSIKIFPAGGGQAFTFLPDSVRIKNGGLPCWSPDASRIAFKDQEYALYVYDFKFKGLTRLLLEEGIVPLPAGWTNDGEYILVALMDRPSRKSTIWKISANGNKRIKITGHRDTFYRHLALSPDGSLLVYSAMEGRYLGLYIMSIEGGKSLPLAVSDYGHNEGPCWSPDGKRITFTSTRTGSFDIWLMDLDIDQIKKSLTSN